MYRGVGCLLGVACSVVLSCVHSDIDAAFAQSADPSAVTSSPTNSRPTTESSTGFQPFDLDDETIYPLSPNGSTRPPSRKSKGIAALKPPPDLRFDIAQSGSARGTIGGDAHAERGVVAIVTDVATGKIATLYAETVDYDSKTGIVTASGGQNPPSRIRLVSAEGTLSGDHITYRLLQRTGVVENATMDSDTFRLHGSSIEAAADGSYIARDAMFTTCKHGSLDGLHGVPDYRISAQQMTVFPGKYVSALRVMLYVGKQKTIPLPSLKRDLNTTSSVSSVPTPSYNHSDGLTLHFQGTPLSARHTTYDYNVQVGLTHLPTGYLLYQNDFTRAGGVTLPPKGILPSLGDPLNSLLQQFNPPTYRAYVEGRPYEIYPDRITFYGMLGNRQYIYNRNITNLSLSRLPEAGVHFGNILGKLSPDVPAPTVFERDRIPYAPALLEAYVSMGFLHESPTGISSGRASSRINFASQPQLLGHRLSWRFAATNWLNAYTRGTVYDLFAPEVELDYIPTSTSVFNIGYRYLTDAGTTPFASDRRDIRHEMRLQYQVGGPYRFGVTAKFDMEQVRAYDEEIAIIRNLDCMQYGIGYRVISQQFLVIFNLLPVRKKPVN